MGLYVADRAGATPVADDTLLALTTAVDELGAIRQIVVSGEGTASAVNRMVLRRSTTNGVTPTAQTPARLDPKANAALVAAATTWGTQPTTAADPALWMTAINVFGGLTRWVAGPGMEIVIAGATAGNSEVSLESDSGTGVISCELVWEEP